MKSKECLWCKGTFVPSRNGQLYCCRTCRVKNHAKNQKMYQDAEKELDNERLEKMKPKKSKKSKYSIAELQAASRKEGMSYGQYVAKYGV